MDRKDVVVRTRLSAAEQERAQRLAELANCSVSEMIRRLVADARVVVRPSIVEVNSDASGLSLQASTGVIR